MSLQVVLGTLDLGTSSPQSDHSELIFNEPAGGFMNPRFGSHSSQLDHSELPSFEA